MPKIRGKGEGEGGRGKGEAVRGKGGRGNRLGKREEYVAALAEEFACAKLAQGGGGVGSFCIEIGPFVNDDVRRAHLAEHVQRHARMSRNLAQGKSDAAIVQGKKPAIAVQQRSPMGGRIEHRAQIEVGLSDRKLRHHGVWRDLCHRVVDGWRPIAWIETGLRRIESTHRCGAIDNERYRTRFVEKSSS